MMTSFRRSTTLRWPESSTTPILPVQNRRCWITPTSIPPTRPSGSRGVGPYIPNRLAALSQ